MHFRLHFIHSDFLVKMWGLKTQNPSPKWLENRQKLRFSHYRLAVETFIICSPEDINMLGKTAKTEPGSVILQRCSSISNRKSEQTVGNKS